MENKPEEPAPASVPARGQLTVAINVSVQGPPEAAEELARAAVAAARVLVPGVKLGE